MLLLTLSHLACIHHVSSYRLDNTDHSNARTHTVTRTHTLLANLGVQWIFGIHIMRHLQAWWRKWAKEEEDVVEGVQTGRPNIFLKSRCFRQLVHTYWTWLEREEKKEVLALWLHVHMYTYSVSVEIQNSHSLHKLWQLVPGGQPLMVWRLKQSPSATASCSTIVFYITGWGLCLPAWSWLCSCFRLCFLPAPAVVVASCRFWPYCRNHRKQRVNSTSHCCCHLYILLSLQHSSAEGREEATVTM